MANLVELSNDLEFVPKEQLIQMSQDPNSTFPPYLVLAEIQRRTQMEKMYDAQQPKPQTSVAEELVAEFAGSPSGLGAMAQSFDTPNAFQSGDMGDMAPPSPMQMMAANGGKTGYYHGTNILSPDDYQSGGKTGYQVGGMTEQELKNQFLQSAGISGSSAGIGGGIESTLNNPMLDSLTEEEKIKLFGKGGILFDPTNPIDYILALSGVGKLGQIGFKGLKALKAKGAFQPKIVKETKLPDVKIKGGGKKPGGVMLETTQEAGKLRGLIDNPITRNPFTSLLGTGYVLGKGQQFFGASSENERLEKELEDLKTKQANDAEAELKAKLEADIAARQKAAADKEAELLAQAKKSRQADMLIGLGGAIGSARNLGELSSGISDAYFGIKSAEQAAELQGLQGALLQAQTAKYETDIANMSIRQLEFLINSLSEQIKEGAFSTQEEKAAAIKQRDDLIKAYTAKTGFASLDAKNQRNKNLGLESLITELG